MAHTDLTKCNESLARDRAACESFQAWAKNEVDRLQAEAKELMHRAEGISEAAQVMRLKLNPPTR